MWAQIRSPMKGMMPRGLWHAAKGVRNGQDSTHKVGSSFWRSPPRIANLGRAAAGTRWDIMFLKAADECRGSRKERTVGGEC